MSFRACLLAVLVFAMTALPSSAASIHSSLASFNAAVNTGTAFTNPFNSSAGAPNYSGNGFAYTLSATPINSLYFSGAFVSATNPTDTLTVTIISGNVSAIGGNFFYSDIADSFVNAPLTINLSDGTIDNFNPGSSADFRGYTTPPGVFITSLNFPSTVGEPFYASMDNLVVGTALVPEPTTALLALTAAPFLRFRRWRCG